jgi:hypothetical protein
MRRHGETFEGYQKRIASVLGYSASEDFLLPSKDCLTLVNSRQILNSEQTTVLYSIISSFSKNIPSSSLKYDEKRSTKVITNS